MTSVHSPLDPRIYAKECRSLAAAGHKVYLVAPAEGSKVDGGVELVAVPPAINRLQRMVVTTALVFRKAIGLRADAYHFHDPELIPWALLLRLLGRTVIYDVHEDYVSAIEQKSYLQPALRRTLALAWDRFERLIAKAFYVVLAERYYVERFPQGWKVLNYPMARELGGGLRAAFSADSRRLLYTGNVTEDRGALNHAAIVAYAPEYELHAIGRCTHVLAERMRQCARANADRIQHVGIDEYVPFSRIQRSYTDEFWLCGLALFPPTPHYQRKELTKFFEYMQAGLPIVCSEFSTWRALVEEEGIGLCVPPDDVVRIVEALAWLRSHPIEAAAMGERGRRLIQERFNWESQAAELRRLYDAILPRQGARHPS